jgi:hypothetical protein
MTAWVFALASHAAAQNLVTVTTSGTMRNGTDMIGLFTSPGGDLTNLPFTLSITGDPSYLTESYFSEGHVAETDGLGLAVMFRGELTVNGHTYAWQLHHGFGSIDLLDRPGGVGFGITAQSTSYDESLDGNGVSMSVGVDSTLPGSALANGTDFNQTINLTNILPPTPYNLLFTVSMPPSKGGLSTGGQGISSYALWSVSPVPEPSSTSMFLAGAGLIILTTRRRKMNAR